MTDIPCQDLEQQIEQLARTIDNAVDLLTVVTPQYLQCVRENYTFPFPPIGQTPLIQTSSTDSAEDPGGDHFFEPLKHQMDHAIEGIRRHCRELKMRMLDLRSLERQHKGKQ